MSIACPACRMESPEGAAYCDFCKEPFGKKPKPKPQAAAAPAAASTAADLLAGIPKEKLLELPAEQLLKADVPPPPVLPPWVRPLAYGFLAVCLAAGTAALVLLQQRYQERRQNPPPGAVRER